MKIILEKGAEFRTNNQFGQNVLTLLLNIGTRCQQPYMYFLPKTMNKITKNSEATKDMIGNTISFILLCFVYISLHLTVVKN